MKKEYFEAFLNELLNWYNIEVDKNNNDLSKLKVLKLLFLGVAKNEEYLDIFDNFVAWDLGPVEKDIYNNINKDSLDYFIVNNNTTLRKSGNIDLSEDAITFGKNVVSFLKQKNKKLIELSASSLVDITHKWDSWNITRLYNITNISKSLIIDDIGYFS